MLSRVTSCAVYGIDAHLITVEVDISKGLPMFSTVGLPDAAVRESKDRVLAAIRNSGFDFPSRRVTVNLAPAGLKKEGAAFDLPIAVGILSAQQKIDCQALTEYSFIGELALDGSLRPIKGVLPIILSLRKHRINRIILPEKNAREASVIDGLNVYAAENLLEVVNFLNGEQEILPYRNSAQDRNTDSSKYDIDFTEVKGQQFAKRAMEVAGAGGHNVIMIGPPGSGKTMLAKRLPTILPSLTFEESIETTKIHSVSGILKRDDGLTDIRPFRSPHHTISDVALIGGGAYPKPGEVSLAHNGILFLDELTEFHRDVLEVLRQPLEDHVVTISRAKSSLVFPASFMLVAAMNPCPCGNFGNPQKECLCTPYQVQKYKAKISGPLLDRIDIHLEIPSLNVNELTEETGYEEPSYRIKKRVINARRRQKKRFKNTNIHCNNQMNSRHLKKYCQLDRECKDLLCSAVERLGFSARAFDRILKVSRTIADLEQKDRIEASHISEAVQYRNLDRMS